MARALVKWELIGGPFDGEEVQLFESASPVFSVTKERVYNAFSGGNAMPHPTDGMPVHGKYAISDHRDIELHRLTWQGWAE